VLSCGCRILGGGIDVEFGEKLQQLRRQSDLTQEQLAERLFVSRTAVSKWESGRGYPNIDSLKSIAQVFSVSIDDLLSGDELITLAASENRSRVRGAFGLSYGIVDLMAIALVFLPFYGQSDGSQIRSVTLLQYRDVSAMLIASYWAALLSIVALGVASLVIQHLGNERWLDLSARGSLLVHAMAVLLFAVSRQPYVTAFLFLSFVAKLFLVTQRARA